jgi:uncharacterized protein (DUF736 family)
MNTFNIFKNTYKEKEGQPDYKMSMKIGDKYIEIGGCWLKDGKDGVKFFSCKLNDPYKERGGWKLAEVSPKAEVEQVEQVEQTEEISVDKIPF